jgi:outer membrane protein
MGGWDMWRALALSVLWAVCIGTAAPAAADTIVQALVAAYQHNPALNPYGAQAWRSTDFVGAPAPLAPSDGYQATKAAVAREMLRATEQTTLLTAAAAYMDLLRDGALLTLKRRNVEVLQEQLRQNRDRSLAGKVTSAGVAQAESRLSSGRADVLAAEAQYAKSRAAYRLAIGVVAGTLSPAAPVDRLSPEQLDLAIEIARARHPDVGVAEAQKRMDLDTARNHVEANVVSSWGALEDAKARILATQAQVAAAEIALSGIREQARVGERTTLDVLNAQQDLINARFALVTAQRDRVVASYTLLAAVGELNLAKFGIALPRAFQRLARIATIGSMPPLAR